MDLLHYLHIATPALLAVPFLTLLPSPPEDLPELPGIRPITIRTVTPRRSYTLLTLSLLAGTYAINAVLLIAGIATSADWGEAPHCWPLFAEIIYAFGGLSIWALTAIVIEWRAKWGDKALLSLGSLGIVCEIPNLVLLVIRKVHTGDDKTLFNILAIPPSALRLILLPILLVLVSNPIIRFEPASENTGLLSGDAESSNRQSPVYGTFGGAEAGSSKPDSSRVSTQGAATPAPNQQPPVIPKKLGEVKKDDKPLTWREIASRLRKLSPHLWPSTSKKLQFFVILCIFFILAIRVANPLVPLALGGIVQSLTDAQNGIPSSSSPWVYFGSYIGLRYLVGSSGILSFANNVLWVPVSQYTDRQMQLLCFNHLLNLSLAYHTKRNTGEVLKIIDRGSAINNLFQTVLFTAIPTVIDIVIAFGVFFYLYGGLLACIILGIMIIYVIFSVTHTNWRMKERRIMVDKDIKQRGIVSDVLTNWESVKYFTAEDRERQRFESAILSYQESEAKVSIGFSFLALVQYFLLSMGLTIGALIIAFRILDGKATPASFVVFIQYYIQMQGPLDRFGWLYRILNQETTDAEKMFNLLSQATEVNDKPDSKDLVVTDGIIEFDNVQFSYDGKVDALKGISFTIGKGESMALVGESGSGKSTILRLLYRFYDINSGVIRIDGQDISKVTQLSLRRAIGIVPQDSVLWNDTIGANVAYGKEGSNDEEIIIAAKAAKLHERIMGFPEQYATVVGERGVRLSGGEKQRVSLARMFLKSPAILVLDEATSALDTETEREIQRALAELAKGRSSLSIAHRLSTIINSDQIVVMKDGQVVEQGGYKELIDLDGAFATMWKKQIFTEAEMVAQLEAKEDLIKLDEEEEEAGPSRKVSKEKMRAIEEEEDAVKEVLEPSEGFKVGGEDLMVDEGLKSTEPEANIADSVEDTSIDKNVVQDPFSDPDIEAAPEPITGNNLPLDPTAIPVPVPNQSSDTSSPEVPEVVETLTDEPSTITTANTSPERPSPSPSRSNSSTGAKIPFPPMPRMTSSSSQRSDLSGQANQSPSPTTSSTDLPELGKDDKRRKRLSSLKGFVRRISDQGGLSRSNSYKKGLAPEEADETTALVGGGSAGVTPQGEEKKKKRMSLGRGKSDK